MPEILLMRHGESQANVDRIFANGNEGYPLTETGRNQAEIAARVLRGKSIDRIYTSPITRAVETATIVGTHLGIEPIVLDEIREFSVGELEGELMEREAEAAFMRVMLEWISGNSNERIPGGESQNEIIARLKIALKNVVFDNPEKRVLMITHGGFLTASVPFVCRNVDTKAFFSNPAFGVGNCSITTLRCLVEQSELAVELVDWSNSSHLE